MVSAFAARRLVLGQIKVNEKSNEIMAIPALIDWMEIEGAVVGIDAMGRQRAIAEKVLGMKADNIFSLKGNQGRPHDDVKLFVAEQQARVQGRESQPPRDPRRRSRPHRDPPQKRSCCAGGFTREQNSIRKASSSSSKGSACFS